MKFAVISPLANLELMNQGQLIFALAQLYSRHEEYANFIDQKKKEGWFILFDNGTGDFDLIESETLLDLTDILRPDEIIAPDILFDKDRTIEECKRFIEAMDKRNINDVDLFFCPQGKNQDEWLEAYQFALDNPYVKTIGLSKLAIPHAWDGGWDKDQNITKARHKCYDFLLQNDMIKKPLHFLGAGEANEFSHYKHKLARSTDSCFSVLAAINNINWKKGDFTRIPTPKNYFTDLSLTEQQIEIFRDNVEVLADNCK